MSATREEETEEKHITQGDLVLCCVLLRYVPLSLVAKANVHALAVRTEWPNERTTSHKNVRCARRHCVEINEFISVFAQIHTKTKNKN